MGHITFKGNPAISETKALRELFPIEDGNNLDRKTIAKGLESLPFVYGELGYINFTSFPNATFKDDRKLGFLEIDADEGKQFHVSLARTPDLQQL